MAGRDDSRSIRFLFRVSDLGFYYIQPDISCQAIVVNTPSFSTLRDFLAKIIMPVLS